MNKYTAAVGFDSAQPTKLVGILFERNHLSFLEHTTFQRIMTFEPSSQIQWET
jgi:hypothetical protein